MDFLRALVFGRIYFTSHPYVSFDYDRCRWGGWDYYAFYMPFLKVTVNAPR